MCRKFLLAANIIGAVLILFVIVFGKISYSAFVNGLIELISSSSGAGIIGGADGPTAIFVSGNFSLNTTVLLVLLPLLLVLTLLILNVVHLKKNMHP